MRPVPAKRQDGTSSDDDYDCKQKKDNLFERFAAEFISTSARQSKIAGTLVVSATSRRAEYGADAVQSGRQNSATVGLTLLG
jgi:hypothetical protein